MKSNVSEGPEKQEGKRRRFRVLAENRTNKALEAIARIGNLSNRQVYDYEQAEIRKIVRSLKSAGSVLESRFESPSRKRGGRFKL